MSAAESAPMATWDESSGALTSAYVDYFERCDEPGCKERATFLGNPRSWCRAHSYWASLLCARCNHPRGDHYQYHHVCQTCQDTGKRCVAFEEDNRG